MPRQLRHLPWIVAALTVAAIALDLVNGRFWTSDFRVYWSAARGLLQHGPVYGVPFGEDTGYFKYAPIVAIAFVPAALLPFKLAAMAHVLISGLLMAPIAMILERILMRHVHGSHAPRILVRAVLLLICTAVLLARELHLGNINLWLVLGGVLATEALLRGEDVRAGILLGAMVLAKPYMLLVVMPVVGMRRWRCVLPAGITVLCGILLPTLLLGPSQAWHLHRAWIAAMTAHSHYLSSPDTLMALLQQALPFALPAWTNAVLIGLTVTLALVLGHRPGCAGGGSALVLWTFLACIPHLVITDQEHFLYSLPLIAWNLDQLMRSSRTWPRVVFALAMMLHATRSSDLWGGPLEAWLVGHGALGTGNLILLGLAWTRSLRHDPVIAAA